MLRLIKRLFRRPDPPIERWSKERLQEVKDYLEGKDPKTFTREDHYLTVEYLVHRYLPADSEITEAQWQARRSELCARVDANIDRDSHEPPEPLPPPDPEFQKWLDKHLGLTESRIRLRKLEEDLRKRQDDHLNNKEK